MENENNIEKMKFDIVDATPEDVEGIYDVQYKTWLDTYPNEELGITVDDIVDKFENKNLEEDFARKRNDIETLPSNARFLVTRADGKVVGFAIGIATKEFNELKAIYVLPEYHGMKIGYSMWEEIKKGFDMCKDTFVNVADYNESAIGFYKRLGFEDTGKRFKDERFALKSGAMIPEMRMVIKGEL